MRLIRATDLTASRWKNGGGETREIAVFPPAAGFDHFDWRLSMATVAGDGPFSVFPGIDRTLFLLSGAGLELRFGDGRVHRMQPGDRLDFRAEDAVEGVLTGGPVTDLNIMTRRARLRPEVQRLDLDGRLSLDLPGVPAALFVLSGRVSLSATGRTEIATPRDTLLLDTAATVDLEGSAELILLAFHPRPDG